MNWNLPETDRLFAAAIQALPAAAAIIVGAFVVKFVLNRALDLLAERTRLTDADLKPTRRIGNWILTGITFILLLGVFGFNLGGLWTMLSTVLAMIAIGFVAVWSVLSNVSCTLIILIFRPFSVGDALEIPTDNVKGRVADLNFIYTTLVTDDGAELQIPNSLFFQRVVKRRRGTGEVSLAEQLNRTEPAR